MSALGQFNSALQGTITDRSNAPVPNASVRIRELTTGIARETVSSPEGVYRFLSLASGTYEINVEKAGFQKAVRGPVALGFGDSVKADFSLQIGALEQTVSVTAEAARVETEIGDVAGRLGGEDLRDLPLNGRNIFNVLALQPGVMGRGVSSVYGAIDSGNDSFAGESEPGLSAAGMRSEANSYTVDGITTNSFSRPGTTNITANSESVDQVRIVTNSYSAEEGRSSGARIQVITKAGNNQFHGGVSYYFQNNTLSTRNVFETVMPVFRKNQFSARLGGPVRKNRTFFYASYEGLRQSGARGQVATVETQQFRDFVLNTRPKSIAATMLREAAPIGYPTYNFRDLGSPAKGTNVNGPADGIMDVGSASFVPNAFRNANQASIRVDHELRPGKDRLYGSVYRTANENLSGGVRPLMNRPSDERPYYISLNHTHTFNAKTMNELRLGFTHLSGQPRDPQRLDIPQISVSGITGFQFSGSAQYPVGWRQGNQSLLETLSRVHGRHSFKFGAQIRRSLEITHNTNNYIPLYAVNSLLDFADDEPAQITRVVDPRTGIPTPSYSTLWVTEWSGFANDDWKVRRNLTVTLGLRYENFGVMTVQPHQGPRGFVLGPGATYRQQIAAGKADIVDSLYKQRNRNFAPRLGFAWDVGGKGRMAIRGGYGMGYDRLPGLIVNQYRFMPPLSAQATLGLLLGTPNFTYSLGDASKPYLGYPVDRAMQLGLDERNGIKGIRVAFNATDRYMLNPRVQNWSFGVQRNVSASTVFEANYLGSAGHHLFDQVDFNRFAGDVLANGKFTGSNPSFSQINMFESNGNSIFHGATAQVRSNLKDITLQAGLTLGKTIDDGSRWQTDVRQDAWNRRAERGPSDYDAPRKFTVLAVWQMPFFRNARRTSLARRALGGWQVSGYAILQAGNPITIWNYAAWPRGDFNADGKNQDRPNGPAASVKSSGFQRSDYLTGMFRVADFPVPTPGTAGSLGRNTYRGPGFAQTDISMGKKFAITERMSFQLRLDAFNAFNRVNLNNPVVDLNSTNFGRATGASTPRLLQAGARVEF
jgi:hypothetical protein